MTGIYKIQSVIHPERIYIGSAVNIKRRWIQHLRELKKVTHHSKKLQNHFNKYGQVDLVFSTLIGCDKEDLIKNEQFFIDSYKPWFNSRPIADSWIGHHHTEESKKRMSELKMGFRHSEESKRKMAEAARLYSPRILSVETIEKLRIASTGKHHSEETKQKIRGKLLGRKYPKGTIKKRGPATEKTKERIRKSLLNMSQEKKDNVKKALLRIAGANKKSVVDIITGERYNSIKEAAKSINIDRKNLSKYLIGVYKNKTNFRYAS